MPGEAALEGEQRLADGRDRRDDRGGPGDALLAQARIAEVLGANRSRRRFRRRRILRVTAAVERMERRRPIEAARVEMGEVEVPRQTPRQRALARR